MGYSQRSFFLIVRHIMMYGSLLHSILCHDIIIIGVVSKDQSSFDLHNRKIRTCATCSKVTKG
jgi:hypothetical protein